MRYRSRCLFPTAGLLVSFFAASAQETNGPDPREIPVPRIKTPMGTLHLGLPSCLSVKTYPTCW